MLLEASDTVPGDRGINLNRCCVCAEEITSTGFVLYRLSVEGLNGIEDFFITTLFGMGEG